MKIPHNINVRFAPSPTGYLHVGGARTALFNYLFAKHHLGSFLLRIEDTDQARSTCEMTEAILQSLAWMGITWDGDPVYQSQRTDEYQNLCQKLLKSGNAYPCFCDADNLSKKRKEAEAAGSGYMYDRTCRNLSLDAVEKKIKHGIPYVLRFKVPESETSFNDLVFGPITVQNKEIDDFVIQRSDGFPVYQIAVVHDDHYMDISHVIRGEDHLSNTPKQILIYQAMGWELPQFAHVPLILGSDKKRLSKRHGATSVQEYQKVGYLPNAFNNFLALLGWSPGDDREILSKKELIQTFSLERVSKKAAVFDEQKLLWMNGQYIQNVPASSLLEPVKKVLFAKGLISDKSHTDAYLIQFIKLLQPRVKLLPEFADAIYFFKDPRNYEENAVQKHWMKSNVHDRIKQLVVRLKQIDVWDEESIENCIRSLAEELENGAGKLIHPTRIAISGVGNTPGLFEIMALIGKEIIIQRISCALEKIPVIKTD